MKKLLTMCALLCVAALPATASAAHPAHFKNASKYCKALKAASGSNFASLYKNHGKCVSSVAKSTAREDSQQSQEARSNASKQCKAEAADPNFAASHGGKTFAQFYGTGNGSNAHGKCVSKRAKENKQEADQQDAQEQQNRINAAKQCKTERGSTDASRQAFANKYGTNANKRNAFGKCVSKTAKAQNDQEQTTTA